MADDWLKNPFALAGKKIFVAGHNGLVGSALCRRLEGEGCAVLTASRKMLDLRRQSDVEAWFAKNKPDVVIVAAAHVGGIGANAKYPAEFLYNNLMIEANVIHAAHEAGVKKLLFLGSSCIYPKYAEKPIREEALLAGALEPTNEAYAVAKIAGVKMCESYRRQYGCDFISAMPCNLYGPGDRFDVENSHVIPALMMKAHAAKMAGEDLQVWGSGAPLRECLYADDAVDGLVFLLKNYSGAEVVNMGSGQEVSIAGLARMICDVVGFKGRVVFDSSRPDGTMRKLMDSSRIFKAGWRPATDLRGGLEQTYAAYVEGIEKKRAA